MIKLGGMPNFFSTPASSNTSSTRLNASRMVFTTVILSFTNCEMSLSPVEIMVLMPSLSACFANAPITSSASTPSIIINGQPNAVIASCNGAICGRKSSGMAARLALYSGYRSSRKVLPLASNTQAQ